MVDRLLVHPLCPYAQRALYALSYKGATDITVEEVDLVRKPSALLQANPCGLVPTLIRAAGRPITESLVIVDFLDQRPGAPLFPRNPDGSVNVAAKHTLDTAIHSLSYDLDSYWMYFDNPSDRNAQYLAGTAGKLEKMLPQGKYFAYQLIGQDIVTAVDIVVFPLVERLAIVGEGTMLAQFPNLTTWYERLSAQPWVQRYKAAPHRLKRLVAISADGEYRGLELPLSRYD